MSRLDLQFSDVYSQVISFLGTGSTGTDLTRAKNIVYRAYRQFLYPTYYTDTNKRVRHIWTWLKKRYTIHTTNGQYIYQLPIDFGRMLMEPTYGSQSGYPPLQKVSCEMIDNNRTLAATASFPYQYAINPKRGDVDQEQMWELWLWPSPNGGYDIKFVYQINPEKPESDTDYFLGGPEAGEVILELSMAIAEQQEDDMKTTHHTELSRDLLHNMIIADSIDVPDTVGKLTSRPDPFYQYGYKKIPESDIYAADV